MLIKNVAQLRDKLAENFKNLQDGNLSVPEAEAMSNIAGKMISSAVAQLKMAEITKSPTRVKFLEED